MPENIMEILLEFICRNFMVDEEEVPLDKSLIDTGIIDSIGLIEISGFITKQFSIKVTEDDLTRENFGSVLKIVDFVKRKMSA